MKNITHSLKIVLVLMMCFAGHAAWAQVSSAKTKFKKSPVGVPYVERSKAAGPKTRGVMSEEWLNYAYCGGNLLSCTGVGAATDYNLAVYVPGDVATNGTISALEFYMVASNVKNVKIWASTTLPASPDAADLAVKSIASLNIKEETVNTQKFKEPVSIPEEGLYVGFSFDVTTLSTQYDAYPIVYNELPIVYEGSCYVQYSRQEDPTWEDLSTDRYGLYLGAQINGEFSESSASVPATFSQSYVQNGAEGNILVPVTNRGSGEINSISYKVESPSGASTEESEIKLASPLSGLMSTADVKFTVFAGTDTKGEERTLTITKVNGVANPCDANTAKGLVTTITKQAENVPVMEEFTGGWCGWCPRGAVALEMLNEKYGDGVVAIAVHAGDAMQIDDYAFLYNSVSGFPSATVNRGGFIDPYNDMDVVDEAKQATNPVSVVLESVWADEAKTSIRMTATTTFCFNQNESNYGLGYVLLQDGMKGAGNGWTQSNYYSGDSYYANDPNLAPLIDMPATINGYEFNHVAIAAWDAENGVDGSLPAPLVADEAKVHTQTYKVFGNKLLQDKNKLTAVVLLIDRNTGKIVNAAKSRIGEYSATDGISVLPDGATALKAIYTLTGQKVTATQPGRIYLYKYADGKVLKSMAK